MNLRTITIGVPVTNKINLDNLAITIQNSLDTLRTEFAKNEIFIRTFRINLSPITKKINESVDKRENILGKIEFISKLCDEIDIRWFNVPFDLSKTDENDSKMLCEFAFEILKRFPKTFINLIVAKNNKINYNGIISSSKFIKDVSKLDSSGYNNFRVGVSCNVKPDTPFFPFTFSSEEIGFSIGLELPQEFMRIISESSTKKLTDIRKNLLDKLIPKIKEVEKISKNISKDSMIFNGIDVSLAPYPEKGSSVAELIEMIGLEKQGSNGTLFITSYLTDILKSLIKNGKIKDAGFNGVMFSLLEDNVMGERNNNNIYSIDSLISYSAVCGCGLDMVPLPGDIFEEELSSIILDVAALSSALEKPLGVRVLPIPMKQENEFTSFNMDFLFNTRIKKIKNLSFINKNLKKEFFYLLKDKINNME